MTVINIIVPLIYRVFYMKNVNVVLLKTPCISSSQKHARTFGDTITSQLFTCFLKKKMYRIGFIRYYIFCLNDKIFPPSYCKLFIIPKIICISKDRFFLIILYLKGNIHQKDFKYKKMELVRPLFF